jgi:hypothetical protein
MTPSDTTIDYKVNSLLSLYCDLWYNSLGSTCTCHYLIVGTNVKLNFRFIGRPIVHLCEGHNSVIRSAIEVHELLLIRFQIDLVPSQYLVGKVFKSSRHSTVVSAGSYIVVMGNSSLGSWPKLEHPQRRWETHQGVPWTSFTLATTLGDQQRHPSRVGGPIHVKFESVSDSRNSPY